MSIYLIRHGQSEHNADYTIMEHIHDSEHNLTELGQKQAKATAELLKTVVDDDAIIYSSPYNRTMQTAKAIQQELPDHIPFFENPLIREWELGNLLNINNRTPQLKKEYKASGSFHYRYPNGESMADVYLRATLFHQSFIQPLLEEEHYKDIIIVSHSAFVHAYLTFLLQLPIDNKNKHKPFDNACVLQIDKVGREYKSEQIFAPKISATN